MKSGRDNKKENSNKKKNNLKQNSKTINMSLKTKF